MKYRNFDPETNQPISALELLQELNQDAQFEVDTLNLTELITKKEHEDNNKPKEDKDITGKILKKYGEIAKLINSKSIRKKEKMKKADGAGSISRIPEFDEYLESKYPLATLKTKEKISVLLTERINELIEK